MDDDTIRDALSAERFSRYLGWAGGDRNRALWLYRLNMELSAALYPALQMLEVLLRNRIDAVLAAAVSPTWMLQDGFLLAPNQRAQIAGAIADLASERKALSPCGIVSAVTFSFWTTMVGPLYETPWQTTLHRIGRKANGKRLPRKEFSGPLTQIRLLRNRIAHHEPILAWNLPEHHRSITRLASWLNGSAAAWHTEEDRFAYVYPPERLILAVG